jgi:hypothetical protein
VVAAVAMASAMAAVVLEVLGRWGQKREEAVTTLCVSDVSMSFLILFFFFFIGREGSRIFCLINLFEKYFKKKLNIFIFFKLVYFLIFLHHFNILMSKIIF